MKVLKTILFLIWLMTSSASSLSVQGEDESSKLSNIFAEDMGASSASSSLTEMQLQRNKNRELRLLFLGALTEQLVKWFFNDILPSEVMHRTKRSLNIPGKNMNFLTLRKFLICTIISEEQDDYTYLLDGAVTALGAVLDREDCRKVVVCNTCSAIKNMVPATQVVIVVADHYVPPEVKQWDKYQVAKRAFLNEKEESCMQLYHCHLDFKHPNEL